MSVGTSHTMGGEVGCCPDGWGVGGFWSPERRAPAQVNSFECVCAVHPVLKVAGSH